jgi:hypothetical protein
MTTNDQIQSLLQRVERLLRTWSHLVPYVEKIVSDAEYAAQKWEQGSR